MKLWMTLSIGIGLLVLNDGAYLAYDQYVRPKLTDAQVWEAKDNIALNQVIQKSDLVQVGVDRRQVEPGAITDVAQIVGKVAQQPLVPHEQIIAGVLDENTYVPGPDERIVSLTPSWIANLPEGLRRGAHVDLSLLLPPGTGLGTSKITDATFVPYITSHKPLLTDQLVEYVRNNGNQEVVSVAGSGSTQNPPAGALASAENGSSVPNEIELKMKNSDWATLEQAIQDGYQIGVAYTPN